MGDFFSLKRVGNDSLDCSGAATRYQLRVAKLTCRNPLLAMRESGDTSTSWQEGHSWSSVSNKAFLMPTKKQKHGKMFINNAN